MHFDATIVSTQLTALNIPVPLPTILGEIYDIEGEVFTSSIDSASSGDPVAAAYLRGILFNVLPAVSPRLKAAKFDNPTLPVLIRIGKTEGPKFSKVLKSWVEAGCPADEHGQYLETVYKRAQVECNTSPISGDHQVHACSVMEQDESDAGERSDESADRPYINRHVYGARVAVCFSADLTRNQSHTIRIEAAESSGERSYNWKDKVGIQLSPRELPGVLATLLQLQTRFDGKGHGAQNEKWFTLENQKGKVFLTVNARGQNGRSLPIGPGDCFEVVTLLMGQMLRNSPFLTSESLLSLVKRTASMSNEPGSTQ
ncbi:hypothetical protein [Pseudomonas abietaniphila]|uniref:Uncharacterized protein n=1 Tax=Pseudomonas abietaniphila TaxID=89065 RepID=A0A1G8RWB0_9PSED|nr:hypothetical protein [Pseudomonas abietaniphila]SDJ21223.1 hypothetical protein SAMN05216605_12377 [Pseudomonas abietaniphila]